MNEHGDIPALEQARPRILLVEDEPDISVSLQAELEDEGFFVCTASNGAEALRLLERIDPPEVILLDLMMPVMDGWQFLKAWRERELSAQIPVIAVSAVGYRGAPGAVAVVPKPLDVARLVQLISHVRLPRVGRQKLQ